MKTAIMTWFKYRNYGTVLQAYAVYSAIKKLGYEPDLIDYDPRSFTPSDVAEYDVFSVVKRRKSLIEHNFPHEYLSEEKDGKFADFISENLSFTEKCITESDLNLLSEKYGAFVCGSDQIWSHRCFDRNYFLSFVPDAKRIIAYAPSMGLSEVPNSRVGREITKLASRFDHLSMREKSVCSSLSKATGKECKYVCDPTLLMRGDEWEKLCVKTADEERFVLFYQLGINDAHLESARKYAEKIGLPLKIIPVREGDTEKEGCISDGIGPREFLSYVKNADAFITDSFHGMIFALLFGTELVPLERFRHDDPSSQNARVYSLLDAFGIGSELVRYDSRELKSVKLDKNTVENIRKTLSESSVGYLRNALEGVENHLRTKQINAVTKVNTLCCGCGACQAVCPTGSVKIEMNGDGFYTAILDESKCVSCGKCVSVCPYYHKNGGACVTDRPLYSYKSKSGNTLEKSSSGGFAHDLSSLLIKDGYTVVGCAFDEKTQSARHVLVNTDDGLSLLQGSKYMQSEFGSALAAAKKTEGKLAFFGTPCQIAAAKRVLKGRDGVVYIDLICHGVPSYNLYKKYTRYLCRKYRLKKDNIKTYFRDKSYGWVDRCLKNTDGKRTVKTVMKDDPYFCLFDTCVSQSPACYECRFRMTGEADLRIGDYWGIKFRGDKEGVSMVSALTENGEKLLKLMSDNSVGTLICQDSNDYLVQQTVNYPRPLFYPEIMSALKTKKNDIEFLRMKYSAPFEYRPETKKEKYKRVLRLMAKDTFGRKGRYK